MILKYVKTGLFSISLVSILSIGFFKHAQANSAILNTKATATLAANCNIGVTNFNFGAIAAGQPSASTSSTFTVQCTQGSAYTYTILYRQYGTDCQYMTGLAHGDRINYTVHAGSTGGQALGNNVHTAGTGTGNIQNIPLATVIAENAKWGPCPTMPPNPGFNPYVSPDNYSDTVSFQVSY